MELLQAIITAPPAKKAMMLLWLFIMASFILGAWIADNF